MTTRPNGISTSIRTSDAETSRNLSSRHYGDVSINCAAVLYVPDRFPNLFSKYNIWKKKQVCQMRRELNPYPFYDLIFYF